MDSISDRNALGDLRSLEVSKLEWWNILGQLMVFCRVEY